jgi:transposase
MPWTFRASLGSSSVKEVAMGRKNRSYRSVDVKKVDRARLRESVEGKRVVFAVDVAKETIYGAFMGEDRRTSLTVRWDQLEESRSVVDMLKELPAKRIEVAMEPTGTYGDPIRALLQEAEIPVYQVAPKRSHDAAEVWDGVPSLHDAKSCEIIGRLHLDGASKLWEGRSEGEREIAAAVAMIEVHGEVYDKRINQIEARLARHWPELSKYLDLTGVTILEVLAEMGGPRAVREQPEESVRLMRKVGGHFLAEWKIEAVVKSARETIGMPMIHAEETALQEIAKETRRAQKKERQARAKVERLVQQDDETQQVADLVGKVTAAVFIAQLGSIAGYDNAASVEKAFGLNLKVKSSGKFKGQLRITKRGPGLSRKYLYLAILRLIQNDPVVGAWYAVKVRENGGYKKKAVVAVMRKVARALWYVAKGAKFDSRKLFNVGLLKARLAA